LLGACQTYKNHPESIPPLSKGLNTPVYLDMDTTTVFLQDYVLYPEKIDSIKKNSHYSFVWNKDNRQLKLVPNQNFESIENLRLFSQGGFVDIPLFKSTKKQVVFRLKKTRNQKGVKFKSQITNWQAVAMQQDSLYWYYRTALEPGNYQYLFVIEGKEICDPDNRVKVSNGMGGYNSVLKIPSRQNKTPFLFTEKQYGVHFELTVEQAVEKIFVYCNNRLLTDKYVKISPHKIDITIPQKLTGRNYIRIYSYNDFGRGNDLLIPLQENRVVINTSQLNRRDFHRQIMYFLMVDRFKDGLTANNYPVTDDTVLDKVNFKGGDLQGVVQVLKNGYFKELGINTIWLSPILKNPDGAYGKWIKPPTKFSAYHGYWPVSNIHIDQRFGNDAVLHRLLEKAHRQQINVLLDYVANHVHKEHILYKKHPDWFTDLYLPDGTLNTEKWDTHRLTTWFDTFLPTIDFSKHFIVEKMTDSAMFWLQQFDIDGFRHDATKHIQLDYWRTLTGKIKHQIHRPVYQIGETYGNPALIRSYVNSGMLDGQFNFNLYDAAVDFFANDDESPERLADALQETLIYYGQHNLMGNISGNQDRVRFISFASGDVRFDENTKQAGWDRIIKVSDTAAYYKLEMLHAFNMCIPGIPCIYYGDEYGMPGANDPDNRRMMRFSGLNKYENHLKEKVKKLINLRNKSMALLYGTTEIIRKDKIMIIIRRYFDDKISFVVNKSGRAFYYQSDTVPAHSYKIIRK
jgi:glycosidase